MSILLLYAKDGASWPSQNDDERSSEGHRGRMRNSLWRLAVAELVEHLVDWVECLTLSTWYLCYRPGVFRVDVELTRREFTVNIVGLVLSFFFAMLSNRGEA